MGLPFDLAPKAPLSFVHKVRLQSCPLGVTSEVTRGNLSLLETFLSWGLCEEVILKAEGSQEVGSWLKLSTLAASVCCWISCLVCTHGVDPAVCLAPEVRDPSRCSLDYLWFMLMFCNLCLPWEVWRLWKKFGSSSTSVFRWRDLETQSCDIRWFTTCQPDPGFLHGRTGRTELLISRTF